MSVANPHAEIKNAESHLVSAITAATEQMNRVGTTTLEEAVEKYREAAVQARQRLASAYQTLFGIADDVVFDLEKAAQDIKQAINPPAPQAPEPIKETAPEEPSVEQIEEVITAYDKLTAEEAAVASQATAFAQGHFAEIDARACQDARQGPLNGKPHKSSKRKR